MTACAGVGIANERISVACFPGGSDRRWCRAMPRSNSPSGLVHQTIPDLPVPAHTAHDSKHRLHFHARWSRQAAGATLLIGEDLLRRRLADVDEGLAPQMAGRHEFGD